MKVKNIRMLLCVTLSMCALKYALYTEVSANTTCIEAVKSPLNSRWREDENFKHQCPTALKVITWFRLREGKNFSTYDEYLNFLDTNPDWPWEFKLRKNAEALISQDLSITKLKQLFSKAPPKTYKGATTYINALLKTGERQEAKRQIHLAWTSLELTGAEQDQFAKQFKTFLTAYDHEGRLRFLLKNDDTQNARALLAYVPQSLKNRYTVRLNLIDGKGTLPVNFKLLQQDNDLLYSYVKVLRKKYDPQAEQIVLKNARNIKSDLESWWKERHILARRAMEKQDYSLAYKLVENHGLKNGESFSDAEFFLGWVGLRFLKNPEKGLSHFHHMFQNVRSPILKAKASYWIALSYETKGQNQEAHTWYHKAAKHPTAFYGQMAALKLGKKHKIPELKPVPIYQHHRDKFEQKDLVKVARLLVQAGQGNEALSFLSLLAKRASDNAERYLSLRLAHDISQHYVLELVREITPHVELPYVEAYPTLKQSYEFSGIEPSFIHAIIRKESGFNPSLISPKNAQGLMQLVPGTAKSMAKRLGLSFDEKRLLSDPSFNVKLGSYYLKYLMDTYKGSAILAIAAYNAGPKPVNEWISQYGDPRDRRMDWIDWIESVPYGETRNYLYRVLEAWNVYRMRLQR